jgi:hypothetical protein
MAAAVEHVGPISSSPEFKMLLRKSKEELAQKIIALRDVLRILNVRLRAVNDAAKADSAVSSSEEGRPCSRCAELEEELTEAQDVIRRFIEGQPVEWS